MILIEAFASFVFLVSWLHIRSYPLNTKFQFLIKPFFVYFVYQAARLMSLETAGGPLNPLLALEVWIWDGFVYSKETIQRPNSTPTIFEDEKLGKYIWCYVSAPFIAAVLSGLFFRL